MGDGFSNPASKMPISSSRRRNISSNSRPLVAVTSSVCGRTSFGGGRRPTFHESLLAGLLRSEKKKGDKSFKV